MSRETRREVEKQKRRHEQAGEHAELEAIGETGARTRKRTGWRQFLREVRVELKRVAWPSRKEVALYSFAVLFAVSLITVYIFALDQAFGQLVFWIFQ